MQSFIHNFTDFEILSAVIIRYNFSPKISIKDIRLRIYVYL